MTLNCVITDDEPIAIEIIERYVNMVPELHLVSKCKDAMETYSVLKAHNIDLLFIDIEMPDLSGIDLVRSLKTVPGIIFTTAYPNYAITGYDLNAIDYLLKPISFNRFLAAIDKVMSRINPTELPQSKQIRTAAQNNFFFIKSGQDVIKIAYDEILVIECLQNYIRIHCHNKVVISLSSMKLMDTILSNYNFLRIHRSYIVNLAKVDAIKDNLFFIQEKRLPIGRSYKKNVNDIINGYLPDNDSDIRII